MKTRVSKKTLNSFSLENRGGAAEGAGGRGLIRREVRADVVRRREEKDARV